MKSSCLLASSALLGLTLAACGSGSMPDPGSRTGDAQIVDLDNLRITVHGRAQVFPEATPLLTGQGRPPLVLAGMPLAIEEPLRVDVSDAEATFATGTLEEDAGFSIPEVPVKDIHLSLAASLEHEGLARTSTIVFDTAFTGSRPRTDVIGAQVWAVPVEFVDALDRAVGAEALQVHTNGQAHTLQEAGFVLGRVVDAKGQPVAGARVRLDQRELVGRIYYPLEDLSQADREGTSANGLFVYVHSGGDAETFRVSVEGLDSYVWRNAGAMAGRGLVLTLYPGAYAP